MAASVKMETEVSLCSSPYVVSSATPRAKAKRVAKQRHSRKTTSTAPAFLSNLGRATLRGIRKCPQCGVYNGTRGLSCKNKACGVALRNPSEGGRSSKKCAVEVVKVIIDSEERGGKEREEVLGGSSGGVQVYSVCHRGRGATATQLGFVQLVPTDTAIATGDGATLLTRINLGRCFLPSCRQGQRSNQDEAETGSANNRQSSDCICVHINQAIECQNHATPLTLKSSVLDGLQASVQAREELWRLATESPGPLVQRVSKDTLVVKCHTDSHHPLGLLHLTVGAGGLSGAMKSERRGRKAQQQAVFRCACLGNSRKNKAGVDGAGGTISCHPPPSSATQQQPCLHFYACVCAIASDEKLAAEFAPFISYTASDVERGVSSGIVLPDVKPLLKVDPGNSHLKGKKLQLDEFISNAPTSVVGREGASASGLKKAAGGGGLKALGSAQVVDERAVTMGFHQWLASVTERIHQTMHYQCDGKPQPLVYHIPQDFFNALQHRLSLGSKKRRLPNFTTAFVRNDGLRLGSLSKYTWHITNPLQVKRILDTPELPLELFQSFVKNADGSYSPFCCPDPPAEPELPEGSRTDCPRVIRPMELRTFLKVGSGTAGQKEASPFVIEWIPDVLPRCQMGELRISFEFGHQQSGQPELGGKVNVADKGSHSKSISTQTKPHKGC